MQSYTFHIHGMHCKACSVTIESLCKKLPGAEQVQVSFAKSKITISGDFMSTPEEIAAELTKLVQSFGYTISVEKKTSIVAWEEFAYALPIAIVLIAGFVLLQKVGLTNLLSSGEVSYGTAFFIGLIASVSSCLAIVGGLVLSLSATAAKEGGTWRTPALFHAGRLGGFFVLGGLVGFLGNSLHLGLMANAMLNVFVALVMLGLGLNMLDVFHFTKKLQITMPVAFSKHLTRGSTSEHYLVPALIGIGTFFLPCGFTQSMQLYALSTGSFIQGALTMLSFAFGTLPMLALLSFGSFEIAHQSWKGIFFKTAGIIVIVLALVNVANALATAGIISPLFNF